ncbi:sigma-70 family RNA polymerase sigma factor [Lacticigenium naphthae]|uniref:sigma-70 family RNA polymerase sigma factor n=1 Tax=Lacticigenium naphthae TaxID=515351 RepID=UPI0004271F28|nr:sigma-70 family RNA polymerase sigma factor [Lacticigenium naphthae]
MSAGTRNKKKRSLPLEMEQEFFAQYKGIIVSILRKRGIFSFRSDYDDYFQNGSIKLVEAYEQFPLSFEEEAEWYQFVGYAYRKIDWYIVDCLRKDWKKSVQEQALPEFFEETEPTSEKSMEERILEEEWLQGLLALLTPRERNYVVDTVIEQLSASEIAKKHHVSRKTVYVWRKQVAKKLAHLQTCANQH